MRRAVRLGEMKWELRMTVLHGQQATRRERAWNYRHTQALARRRRATAVDGEARERAQDGRGIFVAAGCLPRAPSLGPPVLCSWRARRRWARRRTRAPSPASDSRTRTASAGGGARAAARPRRCSVSAWQARSGRAWHHPQRLHGDRPRRVTS
jgi:hypothetical protein